MAQWKEVRNPLIERARDFLRGKNEIAVPASLTYIPVTARSFLFAGIVNQKVARFGQLPRLGLIPPGEGQSARTDTENMEAALNSLFSELERRSGGSVWSRAVQDCIALHEGVIRIDRAPAAFWPELQMVKGADGVEREKFYRVFEGNERSYKNKREDYKEECGAPLRWDYIPLESFYPIYEGDTPVEAFELERRSLRSVLTNPLFADSEFVKQWNTRDKTKLTHRQSASILRYSNQGKLAYYAYAPRESSFDTFPDAIAAEAGIGQPALLYETDTGLGRIPYARLPGRFGGWLDATTDIEQVMNAVMHENELADYLFSQEMTTQRRMGWPTRVAYFDATKRDQTDDPPKSPDVPEGGTISMWLGEKIEDISEPRENRMFIEIMNRIQNTVATLGGSPALFGVKQPGVDTGYQENLQVTQSESLDTMIAQGLKTGFVDCAHLVIAHARAMGETIPVKHVKNDRLGRRYAVRLVVDPVKLEMIPEMDARVTKPRPIDQVAAARAFIDLTSDRGDKGPALSEDTALESILAVDDPALEMRKRLIEKAERAALNGGVLNSMVLAKLNVLEAQGNPPGVPAGADMSEALGGAVEDVAVESAQAGGISPEVVAAAQARRTGGVPAGTPQPEQQVGRQAQMMRGGG